ncbi:response regulator [Candidatus Kapaibacterium sp.]
MTRILIIDDEEDITNNLRDLLEIHDYEVSVANNGEEGIKMILSTNPDLIICDINMPVMSGLELIQELRKYPEYYMTPFLFLTANSGNDAVRLGMRLGADDYLTKPYKSNELLKAVDIRLAKSRKLKDNLVTKLDDVKKNISYSIPDNLKKTLDAIVSYSKLLQGNKSEFDATSFQEFIGDIQESGERLLRLVENYNIFNNLISNSISSSDITTSKIHNPETIIKKIGDQSFRDYDKKCVISYDLSPDITLNISNFYFTKIISELIDNAFKFADNGTKIKVVSIVSNAYYIINITNFGRGMERDEINSIDAFVQFKRNLYEQQGIGLGLVIAKKIVEICNGKLSIESKPGDFITVRAFIPVSM